MKRSDISVPLPCNVPWDTMTPAGRARFCESCQAQVHDLSSMPEPEARVFLASRAAVPTCVRYLADAHEAVLFGLVPSGFVPVANLRRSKASPSRALLGAATLGVASLLACTEPAHNATTGIVAPGYQVRLPEAPPAPPEPIDASAPSPTGLSDASVTALEPGTK